MCPETTPVDIHKVSELVAVPQRRRRGSGAFFYSEARRRWICRWTTKDGKLHSFSDPDPEKVRQHLKTRLRLVHSTHEQGKSRRGRAEEYVLAVLEASDEHGWTNDYTAKVMIASLGVRRLDRGVFGPCAYCGDWLASTIDHILPKSQGGTNRRDNLASACSTCNTSKGNRTPEQWRHAA